VRTALTLLRSGGAAQGAPPDRSGESAPRGFLFDEMFDHVWDQRSVTGRSRAPVWARLALQVHRRRDEYDVLVSWGERLSLSLMALDQVSGRTKPHVALISQFSKPNVDIPMRLLGRQLRAAIVFSSVQRDYAIAHRLFAPEQLFQVRYCVDEVFYQPRPGAGDIICSVGAEMRDYLTLFRALESTPLRCHVAADVVRVPGRFRLVRDRRIHVEELQATPNPNITVGRKTLPELRDLYARSRFVVVPLLQSHSDNGITVILEAMAMGKAVISTATIGQVDVIEDGVTGILVPVGDAEALRRAMVDLWNDPDRARAIGERARAWVERYHTMERFRANISAALGVVMAGSGAPPSGWWDIEQVGQAAEALVR
jgi:glycosyltransferase involved in cell wall biosynthesis